MFVPPLPLLPISDIHPKSVMALFRVIDLLPLSVFTAAHCRLLLGLATGGVITGKGFKYGCVNNDEKEIANSLAVYGAAVGARMAAAAGFGAGCCSGLLQEF